MHFCDNRIVCVVSRRIHLCVKWKNDNANFTQNFTRLVPRWFHPYSFPFFIAAAFPLLSRTSRAFLRLGLYAVLT
jgi:hypothetical protein